MGTRTQGERNSTGTRQGMNGQGSFARPDGNGSGGDGKGADSGQGSGTELPVKSWEAYKNWCEQVRENWEEESEDSASTNSRPNYPGNHWNS